MFDHVSMTMQKGFRMLVLGWSDGNSFVPILHRLLASSDDKNVIGVVKDFDKRSVAYKRRKQAAGFPALQQLSRLRKISISTQLQC